MNKFDIKIMSINWGNTPMDALKPDENEFDKWILDSILTSALQSRPDIFMHCSVPSEFNPIGNFNVGITAGIETDLCSPAWIEGCNRMQLVLVPSEHAKSVFMNSTFAKFNRNTHQPEGELAITTQIEVLPEGVRLDVFDASLVSETNFTTALNDRLLTDFNFLFVGHWLPGDFGQDRKDVSGLVMQFIKAFSSETPASDKPGLILKTCAGTFSVTDRDLVISKINSIRSMANIPREQQPNIYLLHGDLTENQMAELYNHAKVKAFVSFTKGEGYGRPIAEFIPSGKPVLVSGWSGHVDFVNPAFHQYLPGELTTIHPSSVWKGVIEPESKWFTVNYEQSIEIMKDCYKNYKKFLTNSKKSVSQFKLKFSFEAMHDKFMAILDQKTPKMPEKVTIQLPKLVKREEVV